VRAAITDRGPGRFARVVLIVCAVVHGVLGALTVGLVGWPAFVFMMIVLGLIVLPLVAYENGKPDRTEPGTGPESGSGAPTPA